MQKLTQLKKVVLTTGLLSASLIFILPTANADADPFNNISPTSSYMLAEYHGGGHEHGMKKMDTDGNGEISKDEFMAHKEKKFMMMDKNSDGKLSGDEMKHKKCRHGDKKQYNKDKS